MIKLSSFLLILCFVAVFSMPEQQRHKELQAHCAGDTTCVAKGLTCLKGLRVFVKSQLKQSTLDHETKRQVTSECLAQNNLVTEFRAFEAPEYKGRKTLNEQEKETFKVISFVRSQSATTEQTGAALRCCLSERLGGLAGFKETSALKERIQTSLADLSSRDAYIAGVDICGVPTKCAIKDYTTCLLKACIEQQ